MNNEDLMKSYLEHTPAASKWAEDLLRKAREMDEKRDVDRLKEILRQGKTHE